MLLVIQNVVAEHNKVLVIGYENNDDFCHHSWEYCYWSDESRGFMRYENLCLIHIQGDNITYYKTD
jgi:hypothetical protein